MTLGLDDAFSIILTVAATLGAAAIGLLVAFSPDTITFLPSEDYFVNASDPKSLHKLPSIEDEASVDLTVVIPAYNEATRLPIMLDAAFEHLYSASTLYTSFEILIVDDGSKDETVSVALSYTAQSKGSTAVFDGIRVVKLAKNRGKGAAVKKGFLHARGRRILMVDADGASQFRDLALLWKAIDGAEQDGHAVAVGSRAHLVDTEAVVKRSFIRNVLMRGLHLCLRILGVSGVKDTQCGFKLFTRPTARLLFPPQHIAHWIFDVELLMMAFMLSIPVVEVSIAWHEIQGSKINLISDSVGMLLDLLMLRANFTIGRWRVPRRSSKAS